MFSISSCIANKESYAIRQGQWQVDNEMWWLAFSAHDVISACLCKADHLFLFLSLSSNLITESACIGKIPVLPGYVGKIVVLRENFKKNMVKSHNIKQPFMMAVGEMVVI